MSKPSTPTTEENPVVEKQEQEAPAAVSEEEPKKEQEDDAITPPNEEEDVKVEETKEEVKGAEDDAITPPNEEDEEEKQVEEKKEVEAAKEENDATITPPEEADQEQEEKKEEVPRPAPAAPPADDNTPVAVRNQDSPEDDGITDDDDDRQEFSINEAQQRKKSVASESDVPNNNTESSKPARRRSISMSAVSTDHDDNDDNDELLEKSANMSTTSGRGKLSRKSSSFMDDTRSSSAKRRSNTPHPNDNSPKRPAWKPSSKGKDILTREQSQSVAAVRDPNSPNFVKKNATSNGTNYLYGDIANKLMGIDGRTTLPPIKQSYATNLFQQLHIAIHGRPPIGIKKKDGSRSAMFKKSAGLGSIASSSGGLPYSLVPPAAQNSANNFSIPPALLMPTVSTLNTSVTSNTARMRANRNGTSVLSLLCITGNAETDTNPSASTCLRVIPSHADHRSIAVERVVPALPREGARFVGTFLGEDSTFLSRQFMTYDGIAAYEEDWQVLGDLVAGDFLAASLTQGTTRSGVVLLQSGPESEAVTNAFCDGTQPFLKRMSEVLIGACKHGKYGQQQANSNNNEDEQSNQQQEQDDSEENNTLKNPLQHTAVSNLAAIKRKTEKEAVKKRGPAAAAAAISQQAKFSKSINNALLDAQNQTTTSPNKQNMTSASIAEFTTIESLIHAYSFDFVAVSALDIAPGAQAQNPEANSDDIIYDLGTMDPVILTQRKKHVPFKHSAIPIWTLPNDDIPNHHFRASTVVTVPASPSNKGNKKNTKKKKSSVEPSAAPQQQDDHEETANNLENTQTQQEGEDEASASGDSPTQPANKKKMSFINKGTITNKNCKTAEEISEAVASFMQTKSPHSGCHRLLFFTLRKEKENEDQQQNQQQQENPFHLTYEPTIIFCFLSSNMRRGKSQLDSSVGSKAPDVLRAIQRDHKEVFQCLEHVSKYDGMGKEQCMLQPYEFEGALTNLLSTYAWLRADCCRTLYLASVKAFSESPDETSNVLADADRVKRYPVHPRASTSFVSQGLPPIELPPLVAKQAAHILGKNIISSPRSHPRQQLAPSPPKGGAAGSPRGKQPQRK